MNHQALAALLFCFSACSLTFAQESDSTQFVSKIWNEKSLKEGVVWKQAHFENLFDGHQEINFIEIDLTKVKHPIKLAGISEGFKNTTAFANEANAIAAINGAFFNTKTGGGTTLLKVEGRLINTTVLTEGKPKKRSFRSDGALVFDKKHIKIIKGDARDTLWDQKLKFPNVMTCGPLLLSEKERVSLDSNAFNNNRHPRTAVALTVDKKLILMTVDGRNAQAYGMSLPELTHVLKWLKGKDALNLDGGGSSTLFIKGQNENGIVNYPTDNKLFDHEGERPVANAILVL
ncbi:phosphodiester glycosidase family protein [Sphingobacterium sp. SYP-B4668]|uniref:phosphodiester glycosidase family protein n=1 Tax=Sphingobacterium sp. SYP-B4668 TaxID=2996035 RepID=UPI0022DD371C|nr:phosphodiester glycosidase family protein [Sphingobacterium sp. SYP-B4668]